MTHDETAAPQPPSEPSLGSPDGEVQNVRIRMLGPGHAEVLLHGIDIASDLIGFQLTAPDPRAVPELVLMLGPRQASGTSYEGMARVLVGEEPDPGPAAARFLEAIDPEQLQQAALGRADLGAGPNCTTEAILRQLQEWARGGA